MAAQMIRLGAMEVFFRYTRTLVERVARPVAGTATPREVACSKKMLSNSCRTFILVATQKPRNRIDRSNEFDIILIVIDMSIA